MTHRPPKWQPREVSGTTLMGPQSSCSPTSGKYLFSVLASGRNMWRVEVPWARATRYLLSLGATEPTWHARLRTGRWMAHFRGDRAQRSRRAMQSAPALSVPPTSLGELRSEEAIGREE